MSLSHIGKTICTVFSPNGDLYTFWNDYLDLPTTTTFKDIAEKLLYTFTKSENRKYRCLLFKKHYSTTTTKKDPTDAYAVMYNDSTDWSSDTLYPLYECLSPNIYFNEEKSGAVLTFWSNMNSSYGDSQNYKDKLYDRSFVKRYEEDQLDNIGSSPVVYRCLFSAPIIFNQYMINDSSTIDIYPICAKPHLVFSIKEKIPVTDFSTGGGSGGGAFKVHMHTSTSDGGFAYAVYHPGTAVPSKPWR